MRYDPLEDRFVSFEAVETPKAEVSLPLLDTPLDVSDWSYRVSDNGTPIVQNNLQSKMINNNPTQAEIIQPIRYNYKPIQNYNQETIPESNQLVTTYSLNNRASDKEKYAMNFFINKGLPSHAAAGIVGNLIHESNLNTSIKGDGGRAFGIAQWHPDRQKGLKTLAQSRGTAITDFDTQLEYVWQELNNSYYRRALDGIINSTNVEQATTAFMKHFEKPGKPYLERRIKHAKSLLS